MASLVDERLERRDGFPHDGHEIEMFRPNLDQAPADARHVHEVVHESQQSLRLQIDRLDQLAGLRIPAPLLQQVDRVGHGGQRVPQLVPQHGDELVLPLAGREESGGFRRASGDVFERQQHQVGAVGVAGNLPRAQRDHPVTRPRELERNLPLFQRLAVGQQCAQPLVKLRDVPTVIAHVAQEAAFDLRTGGFQVRRECRVDSQNAKRSVEHRQRLADRLDDDVRIGARAIGGRARRVELQVQYRELLVSRSAAPRWSSTSSSLADCSSSFDVSSSSLVL